VFKKYYFLLFADERDKKSMFTRSITTISIAIKMSISDRLSLQGRV